MPFIICHSILQIHILGFSDMKTVAPVSSPAEVQALTVNLQVSLERPLTVQLLLPRSNRLAIQRQMIHRKTKMRERYRKEENDVERAMRMRIQLDKKKKSITTYCDEWQLICMSFLLKALWHSYCSSCTVYRGSTSHCNIYLVV